MMDKCGHTAQPVIHGAAAMFMLGAVTSSLLVLFYLMANAWLVDGASEYERRAPVGSGRNAQEESVDAEQYQCQ
ncbi:MAG: hypothetical protein KDI22_01930 [Gammaproteobacteria bacterium]|nr:hypothetical protein [Gammaproteobacteria bacterium]MCP5318163.1 hypothetical protein [Chromatiaceae bacterium]MCW5587461.1 hypothetical protein [Chromatiales bacterium]MCP5431504.1 hypothetical protein [Chromatiaceae bacterium]HPE81468.1 hypothetical protein [Gammaproteobacteria bacterium]